MASRVWGNNRIDRPTVGSTLSRIERDFDRSERHRAEATERAAASTAAARTAGTARAHADAAIDHAAAARAHRAAGDSAAEAHHKGMAREHDEAARASGSSVASPTAIHTPHAAPLHAAGMALLHESHAHDVAADAHARAGRLSEAHTARERDSSARSAGVAALHAAHDRTGHAAASPNVPAPTQTGKKGGTFTITKSGRRRYVRK